MSDRQALLAAIRDDPDNPAPRLAFAVWLEKSAAGQPDGKRDAALAQAEVARWYAALPTGAEPVQQADHRRIWKLWLAHEKAWLLQVPKFARNWVRLDRGLPTTLDIPARKFLEHGERLLAEVPFTALRLDEAGGVLEEIVNAGLLKGLRELDIIRSKFQDAELARLFRSPDLSNLRRLSLSCDDIGEEAAFALATSGALAGLTYLHASCGSHIGPALADRRCTLTNLTELSCCDLDSVGVVGLVGAPVVDGLTQLSTSWSNLDEAAAVAIAESARLARLRRLHLGSGQIGDAGLRALADSPHLRGLELLGVPRNGLTAAGTGALGRSPLAASLRVLRLGSNSLGDEAAVALFEGSTFRRLEELSLGDGSREGRNNISGPGIASLVRSHVPATLRKLGLYFHDQFGPSGAKELAACPAFPRLEEIDLTHCQIGPEGAIALAQSSAFTALRRIQFQDNGLDAAAVAAITRAPWLATLEWLDLDENPHIGPDGAKALAVCPGFGRLEWLGLNDCGIGPEGGLALARSTYFRALSTLILGRNQIGPEAGRAIATAHWLATLTYLVLYDNQIGPEAGEALLASVYLDRIHTLELADNGISGDLRKRFKKRLGTRVHF